MGPVEGSEKYEALEFKGRIEAPLGYGPALVLRRFETLVCWAEKIRAKEMWKKMMRKSNGQLRTNVFEGHARDLLMMGDFTCSTFGTLSMNKVGKFGFCRFVDTLENILELFEEMARLGILPPMKVDAARLLV
jgi:hypothetical protein